ncbi:hypothetical protein ACQUWN_19280 [Rossellomorea aquimaris]|nr:hypothetical protein [Rossellomorea vietnamensis]
MNQMYQFILNMWVFGKVTEEQVNNYAIKKLITEAEAAQILVTPQEAE